jgi:hypothetical protein
VQEQIWQKIRNLQCLRLPQLSEPLNVHRLDDVPMADAVRPDPRPVSMADGHVNSAEICVLVYQAQARNRPAEGLYNPLLSRLVANMDSDGMQLSPLETYHQG